MDVTLLGIVILFRPEQRENAKSPIDVTLLGDAGQAGAAIERTIAD